jgi:hypothetical protein
MILKKMKMIKYIVFIVFQDNWKIIMN